MVGALLDRRYELLELIGTGGMADVYKARCMLLNRNVAIKILKDEFKNDEEFLKRFNTESQAAAGLSHNNIVSIYDVGTQGEIHYIVMEYVEGITLKAYLNEHGPLPWDKAMDFATQIASALQHAHRKGIVHRDIKPQNILVTKDETLKVTDFGIARAVSSVTMKVDDNSMGTAHYCSPEQARGGYTDEKSDIYSLGVVMYEMVTGRLPFEADSSVTVALKHIQEEPVPPSEYVPDLPQGVEDVILRAMKKEQADRFQSASELLIELSMVRRGNPVSSRSKTADAQTKVIPSGEIKKEIEKEKEARINEENVRDGKGKKGKKPMPKEDKVAIIAALVSSFVFVGVLTVLILSFMFPSILPWNRISQKMTVPKLVGYNIDKAMEDYPDFKIKIESEEFSDDQSKGIILSQTPDADTEIKSPYTIEVVVSKGLETVKVPSIVNLEYRQAVMDLENLHILHVIEYESSDEIPADVVMSVSPSAGTEVRTNSDIVTIKVSSGKEESFIVPSVIGDTESAAKEAIASRGFTYDVVRKSSSKPAGTVIGQSTPGGTQLAEKTLITITVSTGPETSSNEHSGNNNGGTNNGGISTKPNDDTTNTGTPATPSNGENNSGNGSADGGDESTSSLTKPKKTN